LACGALYQGQGRQHQKGTIMRAYADQEAVLASPVSPPPPEQD
jgi:hypothetical protein